MDSSPSPSTTPSMPPSVPETGFRRALRWMGYLGLLVLGAFLCNLCHVRHILWGAVTGAGGEVVWNGFCGMMGSVGHVAGFSIALLGTLILASIVFLASLLQFLWAFKRSWRGVAATILLILFGLALYGRPGLIKPDRLRKRGPAHFLVGCIVRFDNALSAFFPSRPSYSEIAPEDSPAGSSALPAATGKRDWRDATPATGAPPPPSPRPDLPPRDRLVFCRHWVWIGPGAVWAWRDDPVLPSVAPSRDAPPLTASEAPPPPADAVPHAESEGKPPLLPGIPTVFLYYFFHLLCYAYSIALVSTFFARRLANAALMIGKALMDAWILEPVFRREHPIRVFWGDGDEAFVAATQNPPPGTRAVFIVPDKVPFALRHKPDPVTDRLNTHETLRWTYASPSDPGFPISWFLARASEHFFLGEDGRKNVIHANGLLSFLGKYHSRCHLRPGCRTPVIHVRIDAESEEDSFFRWADRWNSHSAGHAAADPWHPAIQVVREPTLVAANLLLNHPMHDVPGITLSRPGVPSGAINLLLVGYGAHGKALLRDMLQDAQLPGVSFRATVVDRDARSFTDLEANVSSGVLDGYRIDCRSIDAFSGAFRCLLPKDGAVPSPDASPAPPLWNRIVLAMENDLDNIRLALRIEEHYRRCGLFEKLGTDGPRVIFARVRDPDNKEYTEAFKTCCGPDAGASMLPVSAFGNLDDIYGRESFPDPSVENAAKFLNWIYVVAGKDEKKKREQDNPSAYPLATLPPDAETAWQKANSFDRESSRAAVFGLRNLAWLLGHAPAAGRLPGGAASRRHTPLKAVVEALSGCPELETALAKAEHRRWNAFHFLRSIRAWNFDPDGLKADARRIADRIRASGEQPGQNEGVRENQITARRRHAALVPFGDLNAVAAAFDDANAQAGLPRRSRIARADHDFVQWMPFILAKTDWTFHGEP